MDDHEENVGNRPYTDPQTGKFTKNNPGRPEGVKNKFTRIKEEIVGLWDEANMSETLKKLVKENPKEAKAILQVVASLMPKEDRLEVSTLEPLTIKIEKDTNEPERQHPTETA